MSAHLVARLDNVGDVVLAGPAVRAVAASAGPVTFVTSSIAAGAARLLPGVGDVLTFDAPWVPFHAPAADRHAIEAFVDDVTARDLAGAVILTSFHQSPLPLALLLRLAGIGHLAATCVDYPGSLLDVRQPYVDDVHEVEQSLALCTAAGHRLSPGDDGALRVELPPRTVTLPMRPYVVVHPGASVPARALPRGTAAEIVGALTRRGTDVVVSGSLGERVLVDDVACRGVPARTHRHAGTLALDQFAHLLAGAEAVVCGNTAPAHLAAAVGTPVVEAFAPVVPAHRWRPWRVPHVLLGDLQIGCAGCRCRTCPIPGQPCLQPFTVASVLEALESVVSEPRLAPGAAAVAS